MSRTIRSSMAASRASSRRGQYGSGTVMVWDRGSWTPEFDPAFGLAKGHLKFRLNGQKLKGQWHLVRMAKSRARSRRPGCSSSPTTRRRGQPDAPDITAEKPHSAVTGRSIEAIAAEQDRVWSSGQGEITEPKKKRNAQGSGRRRSDREGEGCGDARIHRASPCRQRRRPRRRGAAGCTRSSTTAIALQAHLENGRVRLFSRQGL